jgi:hypothetical protein
MILVDYLGTHFSYQLTTNLYCNNPTLPSGIFSLMYQDKEADRFLQSVEQIPIYLVQINKQIDVW